MGIYRVIVKNREDMRAEPDVSGEMLIDHDALYQRINKLAINWPRNWYIIEEKINNEWIMVNHQEKVMSGGENEIQNN